MKHFVGRTVLGGMIWGLMCVAVGAVDVSEEYRAEVQQSLKAAGENRGELVKALEEVPEGRRRAMEFLIAHMPDGDARTLGSEFLLKNVRLAYEAKEEFAWAKKVPESLFFNEVLPYAVLNERRDDWRGDFLRRFRAHVKGAKTQMEAIKAINKAIKEEVKVEYNTKRKKADQSPYESMELGMASCTGLSILLTDAFRAVGIPSRVAGIPAWTTKRGNHNWVEVWNVAEKKWQFTEYYPDGSGKLDHAWFLADAAKANGESFVHSIYASSWKPTGQHFPLVWDMKRTDVPAVNVTGRYVRMGEAKGFSEGCELRIAYTRDGERTAVPVSVRQGDVDVKQGMSPKPTDDMNRFFTVNVGQGQIYQVIWKDPSTGEVRRKEITTPGDKEWMKVELP